MKESEKDLEKKLNRAIDKTLKGWSLKLLCRFVNGLPDRLCLLPGGCVVFAQVKTTGEKPTKLQLITHRKLRKLGFDVRVIDNSKDIEKLVKYYAE